MLLPTACCCFFPLVYSVFQVLSAFLHFNAFCCLGEYLDAVHDGNQSSQEGAAHDHAGDDAIGGGTVLYLKDWHFQRLRRGGGGGGGEGSDATSAAAVESPFFFDDDWLNWWYVAHGSETTYLVDPAFGQPLHPRPDAVRGCVACFFFPSCLPAAWKNRKKHSLLWVTTHSLQPRTKESLGYVGARESLWRGFVSVFHAWSKGLRDHRY